MLHGTFAAPTNQALKLGAVLNLAEFAPSIEDVTDYESPEGENSFALDLEEESFDLNW